VSDTLDRLPPRIGRTTRLGLAAAIWTVVGGGLVLVAMRWLRDGAGPVVWVLVPVSLAIGWAKGRYILNALVRSNVRRIVEGARSRFIGTVYSGPSWLLGFGFMALGLILRGTPAPRPYLALLYVFAGSALLLASVEAWTAWFRYRTNR